MNRYQTNDDLSEYFSFKISRRLLALMKAYGRDNDMSLSAIARVALRQLLGNQPANVDDDDSVIARHEQYLLRQIAENKGKK